MEERTFGGRRDSDGEPRDFSSLGLVERDLRHGNHVYAQHSNTGHLRFGQVIGVLGPNGRFYQASVLSCKKGKYYLCIKERPSS